MLLLLCYTFNYVLISNKFLYLQHLLPLKTKIKNINKPIYVIYEYTLVIEVKLLNI